MGRAESRDFERRQKRIAAQGKSRDPSVNDPTAGLTDAEFRASRRETKPLEKDEESAERLKRFLTGQVPLTDKDLSNWLDGLADTIGTKGGDARIVAARKDARRIIADLVKGARAATEDKPIEENWDLWVEGVHKAYQMRALGATPEALADLDDYSAEHTLRLLEREPPEKVVKEG
jgi:hypothetical protein